MKILDEIRAYSGTLGYSQLHELVEGINNRVVVANAILDRVLHHATVVTITGRSYRIKSY